MQVSVTQGSPNLTICHMTEPFYILNTSNRCEIDFGGNNQGAERP